MNTIIKPDISVIVPIYNVEKYIDQCLSSIIEQTFKNIQIICVDDCGSDSSMQTVAAYADKDSRITIIKHNKNKGLSAARNTGINAACGKYITFVDSDDYLEPQALEKAYNAIEKAKTSSVWMKVKVFDEPLNRALTNKEAGNYYKNLFALPEGKITVTPDNIDAFTLHSWARLFPLQIIKENSLYFPEGLAYEDVYYYFLYYTLKTDVYVIDDYLYVYRQNVKNSISNFGKKKTDIFYILNNVYKCLANRGILNKYQRAFLAVTAKQIKTVLAQKRLKGKLPKELKETLELIDLKNNFAQLKNNDYYFLSYLLKYGNADFIITKILLTASKLLPLKKLRQQARKRLPVSGVIERIYIRMHQNK